MQADEYDEANAFINQMFLFGEIFKLFLFILAMIAICLNTRAYMYYAIIIFEDIVIESIMIAVSTVLYFRVEGNVITLILVIVTGILA